jgi:RNA-splicing ligase RtcB
MGHVIRSAGTLGGGNHFIEFAQTRDAGDYWLIIHSGSRYLGKSVAEYWQHQATQYRQADVIRNALPEEYHEYLKFDPETISDGKLYTWVTGGMGESHLHKESIRQDFDGKEITRVFDALSQPQSEIGDQSDDLDWLEGREAHGYYIDMLFAQQYARWNRALMSEAICDTLQIDPDRQFQSIHNYIDFHDLMIRKGATPAREDEELIIPFNMAEGSILARGQGAERFHQTAPHGAGRIMSRRQAHKEGSLDAFADAMDGIYSESVVESVLDEAPMAYKPTEAVVDAIEPTAEVVDWLDVIHNLKAK